MLQNACVRYDESLKRSLHPQPEQSINMSFIRTQAQMVMKGAMLKKDLNLMEFNCNRNPQVKSLIPRTSTGKPTLKGPFNRPRYTGPIYLPKHFYDLLSEEVKRKLDKYTWLSTAMSPLHFCKSHVSQGLLCL